MSLTAEVTLKTRVVQNGSAGSIVIELREDGWHPITKVFPHSTSAYSALGRMVHKDTMTALGDVVKIPVTHRNKDTDEQ